MATQPQESRIEYGVPGIIPTRASPGSEGAVRLAMEKLILPELSHMVREITK